MAPKKKDKTASMVRFTDQEVAKILRVAPHEKLATAVRRLALERVEELRKK